MSWSIPAQIEKDFLSGKAQYRTFQTGVGGQSILPVPENSYAVVFGMDFSPAGGGLIVGQGFTGGNTVENANTRAFQTQQISFYTGADFYPFIFHVNSEISTYFRASDSAQVLIQTIDNQPIARPLYITSSQDIAITVGLILTSTTASTNAIPVTNRTPQGLTYGGNAQAVNTQTNFGPAATPLQFMQPSPKDYQDFAFGLLPNNADGQAFATPDATNGLIDPGVYIQSVVAWGAAARNNAASHYFLCLHYALYNSTVPEELG